jgi:outer membrane receptor protein involved in Fe transport
VDWARGRHAVRFGSLVEGGRSRSDNRTNYLGTFTFASLADYQAGLASTYTRRDGDPLVDYSHWQAGVFMQDDWRARRNLTLSAGLRHEVGGLCSAGAAIIHTRFRPHRDPSIHGLRRS